MLGLARKVPKANGFPKALRGLAVLDALAARSLSPWAIQALRRPSVKAQSSWESRKDAISWGATRLRLCRRSSYCQ